MLTLDFVIIGAEKSGTTLLVDLLRRSPQIAMPEREVRYFRDPFFPDREQPESFFRPENDAALKGIKHPSYLGRPEVPQRIREHSPGAKLIAILRDPVDRTVASYLHYVRHGQIPCLHPDEGIPTAFASPEASPKYRDIIAFGDYATWLEMYLAHFAREQLLVLEFEEFIASPAAVDSLFAFLSLPTPDGLWPLPAVNGGDYDWGRCQQLHSEAQNRLLYDERANIVGTRTDAPPQPQRVFHSQPLELAASVREFLARHYAPQRKALERLRLLTPRRWSSL